MQHYFGDPWNALDFIIVIGSIIDVVLEFQLVSYTVFVVSCNSIVFVYV